MIARRLGAFGGTFDPIHNGHLTVAREVARRFKLDQLLIVPAYRPPHKNTRAISHAFHRHAMAVLATMNEARLAVSTVELEAPDKPYTVETIARLRDDYGEKAEWFFIMGADSFQEIDTWRDPVRVLENANWVVVARPEHDIGTTHLPEHLRARVVDLRGGLDPLIESTGAGDARRFTYLTDYVREEVSSTLIRQMICEGQDISALVPELVAGYIDKYELYRRC